MRIIDNKKLLSCHFKNGMLMLPYYYSMIATRTNQNCNVKKDIRKAHQNLSLKKRLIILIKGLSRCVIRKKDILIFSSTLFNVKRDDSYYNCLHGYYYDLYPDKTLLIEDWDNCSGWRTQDSYENLSFINTYIELICLFFQKFFHALHPIQIDDYDVLISEYPSLFSAKMLSRQDYYVQLYAFILKLFFRYVRPKILIVNCASYGGNMAIVCYVAKQLGIKVIEAQHGVTYKSAVYEPSAFLSESKEYQSYLPDSFFSFGDYWNTFVYWKFEKISVGYPYLNDYISKLRNKEIVYDILIISQPFNGENEKEKIAFVKNIANAFPNKTILFRIHPSESFAHQKEIFHDYKNIKIQNSTTILYEDFVRCKYIIGWYSNCLYEALAFGKVPIIVDNPDTREKFPHEIGVWIKKPQDIIDIDMDIINKDIKYSTYWKSDFGGNVKNYLDNYL